MSTESLRSRLAAVKPGPWDIDEDGCCVYSTDESVCGPIALVVIGGAEGTGEDAVLIAHAPTDLAGALAVIEVARSGHRPMAGFEHQCECFDPTCAIFAAIEAFDALP